MAWTGLEFRQMDAYVRVAYFINNNNNKKVFSMSYLSVLTIYGNESKLVNSTTKITKSTNFFLNYVFGWISLSDWFNFLSGSTVLV